MLVTMVLKVRQSPRRGGPRSRSSTVPDEPVAVFTHSCEFAPSACHSAAATAWPILFASE